MLKLKPNLKKYLCMYVLFTGIIYNKTKKVLIIAKLLETILKTNNTIKKTMIPTYN